MVAAGFDSRRGTVHNTKTERLDMQEQQYVECAWFLGCHEPSIATVTHPTIGDVECCQVHLDWLCEDMTDGQPNPTKMVPPMVARRFSDAGVTL
jgi:hypothetical protein